MARQDGAGAIAYPNRPITVMWSLMARCNLRCTYCFEPFVPKRMRGVPFDLQTQIIRNLKHLGTTHLTFSGGDPLLTPRLRELVELALDHGYVVDLVSNAVTFAINPMETLAHLPISFCFSIDSPDGAVNAAARPGSPADLTDTIKSFAAMMSPRASLVLQGVLSRYNFDRIPELADWVARVADASPAQVSFLLSAVSRSALFENLSDDLFITDTELRAVRDQLEELARVRPDIIAPSVTRYFDFAIESRAIGGRFADATCPAGWRKIVLNPMGDAYACAFYGWPTFGHVREEGAARALASAMDGFEPIDFATGKCVSEACACMMHGDQ